MRRFSKLILFSFFFFCIKDGSDRLMKRASYSLVVIFFALSLLLLTWSIAGIACHACHSSGTFFSLWHTHARACTHAHTHTHTHTRTHTHTHTHTHTTHTHTHTHNTHTHIHTHTHTHTHTHIYSVTTGWGQEFWLTEPKTQSKQSFLWRATSTKKLAEITTYWSPDCFLFFLENIFLFCHIETLMILQVLKTCKHICRQRTAWTAWRQRPAWTGVDRLKTCHETQSYRYTQQPAHIITANVISEHIVKHHPWSGDLAKTKKGRITRKKTRTELLFEVANHHALGDGMWLTLDTRPSHVVNTRYNDPRMSLTLDTTTLACG